MIEHCSIVKVWLLLSGKLVIHSNVIVIPLPSKEDLQHTFFDTLLNSFIIIILLFEKEIQLI